MPPFWALSIIPILTAFLILSGNILLGVDKKLVSIGVSEGTPRFSGFSNTLHNSGNGYTLHNSGNGYTLHNSKRTNYVLTLKLQIYFT